MKLRLNLALVLVLSSLLSTSAVAQIASELRGRIVDAGGAAVPAASVELVEQATHTRQLGTSSSDGVYVFSQVTPGVYAVHVTARGFEQLDRAGITLTVGQTVGLDLQLRIGSDQQIVSVNADAPLLQSETSNIATNIPGQTV